MTTTITAIGIGATISAALTHMSYSAAKRLRSVHDIVPRVETPMTIYTDEAMLDLVTDLPGLSYDPGFKQFSGYLTVDEDHGRKIHYWYVESQGSPSEDPVVYWTNGGPGCSGLLAFGYEHGPYFYSQTGKLSPNPYSWNKVANMLYVEQPAGVGFSYSEIETDYSMDDKKTSVDNYVLIREFLKRFPERQNNDFYVTSESYGGHYMPQRKFK
jgi:carboxypeptidase C (cathepsin A)